ncbi:MAG: alpha-2-macroglobulin family protein [Thermodesulfobacteriota bacterium]
MSQSGHPSSVKTLVIIILLIVIGIQGYFLWKGFERAAPQAPPAAGEPAPEKAGGAVPEPEVRSAGAPAPAPAPPQAFGQAKAAPVEIATFHHDWNRRDQVIVSFNRPVGEAESTGPLSNPPFDISPAVPGEWTWAGPYILRFKPSAKNAFDPSVKYVFKARPEAILPVGDSLAGQTVFAIRPEPLAIRKWSAEADPVPGKPGSYVVTGSVSFSKDIFPQQMAPAVRLIDPRLGEADPVPLEFVTERAWPYDTLRFTSAEIKADSKPRMFTVLVDKDKAESADGFKLAEQAAYAFTVVHSDELKAGKPGGYNEGQQGFELHFDAKVDPAAIREKIVLEPAVEGFTVGRDYGGRIVLSGNFKPGATYSLVIPAGLTAQNGAALKADARFTLAVPNQEPSLKFAHQGLFLPISGAGNLGLESVNMRQAQVRVERVYRNNIFFALNYYAYSFDGEEGYGGGMLPYLGDVIADWQVRLPAPRNQAVTTPLNVADQVREFEPGLYRVALTREGQSHPEDQKWLLITDLGVAAKRGHDDILVWVCSQKDLKPVAGARVKVISATNQVLYQGVTDARGLWRAQGLAGLPEDKVPFMVTAEKDNDYSFLQFERFRADMTGLDVSGVEVAQAGYQAFLWGERDIYRPGETAVGMICVRDPRLGTPPPLPVKLRWTDPQGREVAVENVKTDAQGMAAFSRTIPVHFPTGPYVLEALAGDDPIGQYRFQVEDFRPDRIATSVTPGAERAAPGRELSFTVEGRYLFGAPASGLASEAQVTLTPAPFAPKGFDEYVFGDPERAFEPHTILQQEAALDEEGRAVYKTQLPEGLRPPAALTAVVTARVSEAGGRGVAARIKVPVDAYLSYPGLKKLGQSGLKPGEAHAFEYVVVDGNGGQAQAGTLVAELYEDRWQTVLRRSFEDGGFRYETKRDSRLVDRREIASAGSKGQVSFTPPKYGSYRLVLTDPDSGAAAQLSFWAEGQGYNPWAVENPARLELVPAKAGWMPGETAKLQVRSPYPGKLLVTVESTGVRDAFVADMPANTGEISVPIKQGYGPNVYVTAMLARKGADVLPGQAGRAFGTVSLNVAREAGRQTVTILTPEEIKPLTPLTVTAKADPGGIVTLAAVDEGILQLIAQKTPDPWASFYAKRALEVESFDTWALLLPELKATAEKSPAGGDEDMGRFLRTESPQGEKSVAFWSGPLKADAQGRVQWTIDVPRFQGAIRVMAVAVNKERFGSAQRITRVKSPLVLMPTFPRFAQLDEEMKLPVTLRNDTPEAGKFRIALDASGPMSADEPVREVEIAQGRDATVFFAVKTASAEGVARLTIKAAGNGESTESDAGLMVRSPLPAVSRIQAGVNEGPRNALAAGDGLGFLPGTARSTLRVGRYPLVRFSGKLEDLLGYPHGCIEQTVSKAFPLLYFANLARELEPEALAKSSPEAMVQQGVSRVLPLQLPSGGFGMWPGAESEQAWASVYAAHFLLEASRAGHQVPREALDRSLSYLADLVRQFHQGGAQKTQAYGLYVLALAGRPDKGTMDHMRDKQAARLPADARALLAAAYAASGNAKGGEALLASLPAPQAAPRGDDIFDSPLRAVALTLAALVDADPGGQETARTARELSRLMESARACSTQEAGMAFMAMGKLFARQQAGPACLGKVLSGADVLASFDTSKTAVLRGLKAGEPLSFTLDAGCKPGSVYYSLDERGIPETGAYKPFADGLEIKREFMDREGNPLDIASLKQGAVTVVKTSVRSTSGPLRHVAVSQLLPSGLEVENPRLATTDKLPWMEEPAATSYADYRADRVNVFLDLPDDKWKAVYTLCRAVIPGSYQLPPAQAESMYYPEIKAGTALGAMTVEGGK